MPTAASARKARRQTLQSAHIPAPVGGVNTISPASDMPPGDCVYAYNLIGSAFGLRSRLGFQEWCTGMSGEVRTPIPFSGSHKSGSSDKLFAAVPSGIYDCTSSSASPSKPVTFGITTGDAGFGISCVVSTAAGRFLLFCDEENGLYYYSENSGTWTKVASGVTQLWHSSTSYAVGNQVVNGSKVYIVTSAGTSAGSGGPTGTGTGIGDGTVTWDYVSASAASVIGPGLDDQNLGYSADPTKFAFVTVWGNRIWYVERDTARAWYGDVRSFLGTFTSFDFGPKLTHGGPLAGLYSWSYDAGGGMDTALVGIGTAGDVVIYIGTDPTSASTFSLKGTWFVGGVPYGRRVATDLGGDVLVLSLLGGLPLSKLVVGQPVVGGDRSLYATYKIGNTFNLLTSTYGSLRGWAMHVHPTDNALLVLVPQAAGSPTTQWAQSMSFGRGWFPWRDLPMLSAAVWNGTLYFGTTDGRLCKNTGYVDNVLLSNPNSFTPVSWSLLTASDNLGNANQKRVYQLRPSLLSETPNPTLTATPRFGFDITEPPPPSSSIATTTSAIWDSALWDAALWTGDYTPSQPIIGATGMGRDVAVAVRGAADARTTFVGVDVYFEVGGLM